MKHLVFYDGSCGLCDRSVQFLLKVDKEKKFVFAPLDGPTAKKFLKDVPEEFRTADSIILVENYDEPDFKVYIRSQAVFRICWLLDGIWSLIGWMYFLPSPPYDFLYKIVAKNRHRLFSSTCLLPQGDHRDRFLP